MNENRIIDKNITDRIDEVKYLSQENTPYYRIIMRFFYNKYEQAEYWLYKEDIYDGIKDNFDDYSIEELERNLEFLVENNSLTRLQDTENISSLNDWMFRNYRYQITDKAVIVERMTIEFEELEVKVTSLEPRLFERISTFVKKLVNINTLSENQIYEIWTDLTNDFKNLNEQYQDFLKKFHEAKTEELLQSEAFLEFKSSMINYINNFISSYIKASTDIKNALLDIDSSKVNYMMDMLISHQKKAPKISPEFDFDKLRRVNLGKWNSIDKWFVNTNGISEGERLLEATQKIIAKIYKYASSLLELHGNMINRKEDYIHAIKMFDSFKNISDAEKLSLSLFGIIKSKHFKGTSEINTDSLIPSYDVDTIEIPVSSQLREYKVKADITPIQDKTNEKKAILKRQLEIDRMNKEKVRNLVKDGVIKLVDEINLDTFERRYVLSLIQKYQNKKTKESEYGYTYEIKKEEGFCTINSSDGKFLMSARTILIEGDEIG